MEAFQVACSFRFVAQSPTTAACKVLGRRKLMPGS